MDDIKIEKGIPVPPHNNSVWKRLLEVMEIGDSFSIPPKRHVTVNTAANNYGKSVKRKFTIRKVDGGYRIWRTE